MSILSRLSAAACKMTVSSPLCVPIASPSAFSTFLANPRGCAERCCDLHSAFIATATWPELKLILHNPSCSNRGWGLRNGAKGWRLQCGARRHPLPSAKIWCTGPITSEANCLHSESRTSHHLTLQSNAVASERCSETSPADWTGLALCGPEDKSVQEGRVVVIGIGTAGGKMVAHIGDRLAPESHAGFEEVELWAMNTDVQALRDTPTPHHLQLGSELTKGLGRLPWWLLRAGRRGQLKIRCLFEPTFNLPGCVELLPNFLIPQVGSLKQFLRKLFTYTGGVEWFANQAPVLPPGTGGDRAVGAQAAEVSATAIAQVVGGQPGVCYVICGAGGGTGGGASPLVLSAARAAGHLAVAVVTLPFSFEGQRRVRQARASLAAVQEAADVVFGKRLMSSLVRHSFLEEDVDEGACGGFLVDMSTLRHGVPAVSAEFAACSDNLHRTPSSLCCSHRAGRVPAAAPGPVHVAGGRDGGGPGPACHAGDHNVPPGEGCPHQGDRPAMLDLNQLGSLTSTSLSALPSKTACRLRSQDMPITLCLTPRVPALSSGRGGSSCPPPHPLALPAARGRRPPGGSLLHDQLLARRGLLLQLASLPSDASSWPRLTLVWACVQMLRTSGRAVVGYAEGATPVRALQAALQAPGLGSLHMVRHASPGAGPL